MTPLTPEQVARLRLPEQYSLRESSCPAPNGPWWALPKHPGAFEAARIERHIASTAELCANGHLPPEALDDVWRRAEGTKTDLEIVLAYRSVEIQKNEDGHNCWITLYPGNGKPRKIFDGVVFAEVVKAARKWIEEQGK